MTCNMSDVRHNTPASSKRNVAALCKNLANTKDEDFAQFWDSFDTVLTDCDGVLWLQNNVIPGSPAAIKNFKESGKRVFYVTNNSTKTRDDFISRCSKMEYPADRDDILSTAYLTARYFQGLKFNKKVYIVGSKGIGQELDAVSIPYIGVGPDPVTKDFAELPKQIELDPDVGAVVVGMDTQISFVKLSKAASYLSWPECHFVATNTDEVFPTTAHHLTIPGTGSLVAAVETAAGRKAFTIGKPSSFVRDFLIREHKVDPARTLMIGDRCNTDILFGTRCGFKTLLVLTGVTTLEQVNKLKASNKKEEQDLVPDYYIECLGDILHLKSVLWLQDHIIPGSPESITKLEEIGKKVFYITNNSIKTRDEFVTKFLSLGYPAVRDDVLSTAYLTAHYLKDLKFDKKVYIVGPKGIGCELDAVGIPHIGIGPDPVMEEFDKQIELDPDVGAVVIGLDDHVSIVKLTKAASYLKNPECLFVVTNTDEIIPTPAKHLLMPDTGSLAAAVEMCTGREPFHIGKPSIFIRDFVAREYQVNPARTLMIGDRGNTDILFGTHSGFKTLLVLTGVTTVAHINKWKASDKLEEQELVPDYYIESLGDLIPLMCLCECK